MKQLSFIIKELFNYCLIVFILVVASVDVNAGSNRCVIKGRVNSSDNNPLPAATIALVGGDSIVRNATVSDNKGLFSLVADTVPACITVSHIGYESRTIVADTTFTEVVMHQSDLQLDEVEVRAAKLNLKAKPGRYEFNPSDVYKYAKNAAELLKYVPLISVSNNNTLNILSKSGRPLILINGQVPPYPQNIVVEKLMAMKPGDIKRIDIVMSPGVTYDNSVNDSGILNIILEDRYVGFNGNVGMFAYYGNDRISSVMPKVSLFYQKHSLMLSASGSYTYDSNHDMTTKFLTDTLSGLDRQTVERSDDRSHQFVGQIMAQYNFKKNNSLTAGFALQGAKSNSSSFSDIFDNLGDETRHIASDLSSEGNPYMYLGGALRYTKLFRNDGSSSLSVTLTVSKTTPMDNHSVLKYTTSVPAMNYVADEGMIQSTNVKTNSQIGMARFNHRFQDASILNISLFGLRDSERKGYSRDNEGYTYKLSTGEEYLAADYERDLSKVFSSRVGIRVQHNSRNMHLLNTGEEHKKSFFYILPSVNFSISFLREHSIDLDWIASTQGVYSSQLNPYEWYSSATSYSKGNPDLDRAHRNKFSLNYTYGSSLFVNASYTHGKEPITGYICKDDNGNTMITSYNGLRSDNYRIQANYSKYLFDYRLRLMANADCSWLNSHFNDANVSVGNHSFYWSAGLLTAYELSRTYNWNLTVTYGYFGKRKEITQVLSGRHNLRVNIRKGLWKNAAISADLDIPLNSSNYTLESPGISESVKNKYDRHIRASVNFNWTFGKLTIRRIQEINVD